MLGSSNKIKSTTKALGDAGTSGGPSQGISTRFPTFSFYSGSNINKTTANIPVVDLANEIVTVIPEFDNTIKSDYSTSNNSEISGVKRRCSLTKKTISKKRKVSDAKKRCYNNKGITSKGLARPRGRPKKTKSTITAAAVISAAPVASGTAAPAATAAATAAALASTVAVSSASSAAPDAVDNAENSSSQTESSITAAAVTSVDPVAPGAAAAPAATAAASASTAAASSGVKDKPKYTKKSRVKNRTPKKWWNEQRKTKKNSGEAYPYKVRGNKTMIRHVAAKKVGPPCNCKKKCFDTLGGVAINTIFKDYWGLGTYDLQTADLQKKIVKEPIKRKRTKKAECHKSGNFKFFVYYDNIKYNVCKLAFMSIHAISKTRVKYAFAKKTISGATEKDRRGKNPNPNRFSGRKLECVHEHIQNLEVRSSHYTRFKNPNRQYLDSQDKVTIEDLYNRYMMWMKNTGRCRNC